MGIVGHPEYCDYLQTAPRQCRCVTEALKKKASKKEVAVTDLEIAKQLIDALAESTNDVLVSHARKIEAWEKALADDFDATEKMTGVVMDSLRNRAEKAEARVKELEEGLRFIWETAARSTRDTLDYGIITDRAKSLLRKTNE